MPNFTSLFPAEKHNQVITAKKKKMIAGFNRSITFPMSHRLRRQAAYHLRSVSLPSDSHPVTANLRDQILAVQEWASGADTSLTWIEAGLSRIELLLSAVNEFLDQSEAKATLRHSSASTDCFLECFLRLVDSYGSLLADIVTLKQHHFEAQSAIRRHDSALLGSSVKSQRRIEKEMSHLAVALRATTKSLHLELPLDDSEAETIGVLKEAISTVSAASVVLLNRVVAVSAVATSAAASLGLCAVWPFKRRISVGEREIWSHVKCEELEQCIDMVERGSQTALRSLVNCRVLLLNIDSGLL